MSESLLRAFMQLFALASGVEDVTKESRKIVSQFLNHELNQEMADRYLELYDHYKETYHEKIRNEEEDTATITSQTTLQSVTEAINNELTQRQKIVILIRLLEYIYADLTVSEYEFEFLKTITQIFRVPDKEIQNCLAFIKNSPDTVPDRSEFLLINQEAELKDRVENHHLKADNLDGTIMVLYIASVNMFAFRYFGDSELSLNSQPIVATQTYILNNGASVRGAGMDPIYYSDVVNQFIKSSVTTPLTFTAQNIAFQFKNGGYGIQGVTLSEEAGNIVGIMGSSGSGKTTLLNILNGNLPPKSGQVTLNGVDIHQKRRQIEGVIGYVSQDDLLFEGLTVFENLYYNAQLCFKDYSKQEITETVNSVLQDLGLYDIRHLKVGDPIDKVISGGQRKRLNIALELIREPKVLFVDEPTSGLSSHDSENIMDLLKELALKGKLIFVVIHQPSSEIFKMFDNLLLLDTGGYPIFYGNPIESVIYFKQSINHVKSWESECHNCGNVNPEQIFNIVEAKVLDEYGNQTQNRKTLPHEWYQRYQTKIGNKLRIKDEENQVPESNFNIAGKLKQLGVFIKRDVLSKLNNKEYLLINLLETPVLALIMAYFVKFYPSEASAKAGYIFFQNDNLPAFIFMAVIVALFVGLTVSAEEIIKDQKIRKREQFLNLSTGSYLWSKIMIMFAFSIVQTLLFVLIGNTILEIKGMYLEYWWVLFSAACFANLLGLNISSAFNSAVTIYVLIPLLLIPQLLFSGVLIKFDKLNPSINSQEHVPIIGELMAARWAYEALAVHQFKNNKYQKHFYQYNKRLSNIEYRKSFWVPELKGRLNFIKNNQAHGQKEKKVKADTRLIKKELKKYHQNSPLAKFSDLDALNHPLSKTMQTKLKQYLDHLRRTYVKQYNKVMNQKQQEINKLKAKTNDLKQLKNQYQNESLTSLVKNKSDLNNVIETNGELIAQYEPIFRPSNGLRAHFFAPSKTVMRPISTYWFNVGVLWLMTGILIISLYFDVLRKLLEKLSIWGSQLFK